MLVANLIGKKWDVMSNGTVYTLNEFIVLFELHHKLHKTVMDNSAIAVSLTCSMARKGGL